MKIKNIFVCLMFLVIAYSNIFAEDFKISGFNMESNYYGLPLDIKVGYLFRKNDFSIFPFIGLDFNALDEYSFSAITGFTLIQKKFSWTQKFYYELLPSLIKNNESSDFFRNSFIKNTFAFKTNDGSIYFPISFGKKQSQDFASVGIGYNLFLTDTGFLRSTVDSVLQVYNILEDNFLYYDLHISSPLTLYLNHFELCFIYDFYYTNTIDIKNYTAKKNHEIAKPYSRITQRLWFTPLRSDYVLIHSFEVEPRWYFLRNAKPDSELFISTFTNIGLGISSKGNYNLEFQYGIGLGYTLFDSVPFEMQFGFDNKNNFLFYIGVVSRIVHRP